MKKLKYVKTFEGFDKSEEIKSEQKDNFEMIRDILLEYQDDYRCSSYDTEHVIFATFEDEDSFQEVKEKLDYNEFSYCSYLPQTVSSSSIRSKWRILIWDDVIESEFKSWIDRAKYTLDEEALPDGSGDYTLLCEISNDPKSWIFTMTKKESRKMRSTNFLYVRYDQWEEIQNKFGLNDTTVNHLIIKLCHKYLLQGEDMKKWIVSFKYTEELLDSLGLDNY
jgi:hypothetical protein